MIRTIHDPHYEALLAFLIDARQKRGLTLREFSLVLGEPHQFIGRVETGQRRLNVYEYVQYCEALEINPIEGLKLLSKKTWID